MTDDDQELDPLIFSAVMERDIDLLLVEELRCSEDFRGWLLDRLGLTQALGAPPTVHRIRHSVLEPDGDGAGESDIIVEFNGPSGNATDGITLLIENKISAPFQPDQPERYQARAKEMEARGECKEAHCLLVAPERYVDSVDDDAFVHVLTYEALKEFFGDTASSSKAAGTSQRETQRLEHRVMLISHAIYEWRRRSTQIIDAEATSFAEAYYERATSRAPSLKLDRPNARSKESVWVYFRRALTRISEVEPAWYILHKTKTKNRGASNDVPVECVQIVMDGWKKYGEDRVRDLLTPLLDSDMDVGVAGKSLAIRLPTPTVDPTKPAAEQWPVIDTGLDTALRLQAWYHTHLQQLRAIAITLAA